MNLNEFFSAVYADNVTHDFYIYGSYNTNTYVYGSGIVHVVNGEVQYKKSLISPATFLCFANSMLFPLRDFLY
jgi:hypothetical protein